MFEFIKNDCHIVLLRQRNFKSNTRQRFETIANIFI